MRAKWEYNSVQFGLTELDAFLAVGWEPFAVYGMEHVHLRRLVRAICTAGHDADFDQKTCDYVEVVMGEDRYAPGRALPPCGRFVEAVPVAPANLIPYRPLGEEG